MYQMKGKEQWICDECVRPSCIWPDVCRNLDTDHTALLDIYKAVRETEGIKHAYVASGIRYDLFLHDKGATPEVKASHELYIEELAAHHVPGRIKVAPEHTSDHVLRIMRKPSFDLFYKFKEKFAAAAAKAGKPEMPVTPYFISSHPGSRPEDMADLALKTKDLGYRLEAVQDFTPTPMTVATEIYATGIHPIENRPVDVARTPDEKQEQRSFFFWYKPEMKKALRGTLERLGLKDTARRLLDENRPTRDVTPSPKINPVKPGAKGAGGGGKAGGCSGKGMTTAPCGMTVPEGAPGLPKAARPEYDYPGGDYVHPGFGTMPPGGKPKPAAKPYFQPPKNKLRRD